jgi:hypothetical protein
MENTGMIYELIGKAMSVIGAITKDKKNTQQGFMYRGIDQVYNALNPVLAELGIFFCPEILEQKREERVTKNGAVLVSTVLTVKFTAYAPDGSHVSMTVVGEGMDSGDKSSNKAMSVAMKYAMFQLFCIPTEELKDPDADSYEGILPKGVAVTKQATVPETPQSYILKKREEFVKKYGEGFNFLKERAKLIAEGKVKDIPSATMTMEDAKALVLAIAEAMNK